MALAEEEAPGPEEVGSGSVHSCIFGNSCDSSNEPREVENKWSNAVLFEERASLSKAGEEIVLGAFSAFVRIRPTVSTCAK